MLRVTIRDMIFCDANLIIFSTKWCLSLSPFSNLTAAMSLVHFISFLSPLLTVLYNATTLFKQYLLRH